MDTISVERYVPSQSVWTSFLFQHCFVVFETLFKIIAGRMLHISNWGEIHGGVRRGISPPLAEETGRRQSFMNE